MSKAIIVLSCLLAAVYSANALQCYSCDKCSNDKNSWQVLQNCGSNPAAGHQGACLKYNWKDLSGAEFVSRKCILAEKKDDGPYFACNKNNQEMSRDCHVCASDLCNSASAVKFSLFTVMTTVAAFVLPKYVL